MISDSLHLWNQQDQCRWLQWPPRLGHMRHQDLQTLPCRMTMAAVGGQGVTGWQEWWCPWYWHMIQQFDILSYLNDCNQFKAHGRLHCQWPVHQISPQDEHQLHWNTKWSSSLLLGNKTNTALLVPPASLPASSLGWKPTLLMSSLTLMEPPASLLNLWTLLSSHSKPVPPCCATSWGCALGTPMIAVTTKTTIVSRKTIQPLSSLVSVMMETITTSGCWTF